MQKNKSKLTILVADNHELFRRGVRAALESQPGWQVLEVVGAHEALNASQSAQPHVVILAMYMTGLTGMEAARRIRKVSPSTQVLLVGDEECEVVLSQALQAGARAYLTRATAARDLVEAVRNLANQKPFFNLAVSEFLLNEYLHSRTLTQPALTSRELEIVQLLAEGKSNKEVAVATGTSPKTIETHRARIMRKLKVRSLAELVRYAVRKRLIQP
ncbi:MAG: response regulator transcription factor [Candidatus Korobacteraceae bacterium]